MKRSGVSRRAKLYYLRDRSGKSTRLREKRDDVATETKAGAAAPKSKAKKKAVAAKA